MGRNIAYGGEVPYHMGMRGRTLIWEAEEAGRAPAKYQERGRLRVWESASMGEMPHSAECPAEYMVYMGVQNALQRRLRENLACV